MANKQNKVINLFNHRPVAKNNGVKYSDLLQQLMEPFEKELEYLEISESIIEFSVLAWNFGNLKSLVPANEFNLILSQANEEDINAKLMMQMINYKQKHFKGHKNFIIDFSITNNAEGAAILNVVTQAEADYLADMIDNFEEDNELNNHESGYIERFAIIVKPNQAFYLWLEQLPNLDIDLNLELNQPSIYLIDDQIKDLNKWLKKNYNTIFNQELEDWRDFKKYWPRDRSYKAFKQWFKVEVSFLVYDLENKPIQKL